ncbi:uncharacterized protein SPPG_09170 [Spizellomyces punctatus DAOM BR117]|uniref:Uncharacterized protein n=1 Tax=Spizellomyces punctatus (strain DAOM BR117) TaxID=645134 RepID=A0A0L0HJA5_SPIPD|nr:uncharacterized protein SPPG_09170 [Spizellomyces punctatus DAOM BR117]KND00980.1 hypothetical protein SPPG_09170 [Spizellomyces punctatus DAOM BR117]|eukprot:XP_016609019.1 hypothetical protein SPPG_09170 [Spizellomyces punctatus DAOM BR117]
MRALQKYEEAGVQGRQDLRRTKIYRGYAAKPGGKDGEGSGGEADLKSKGEPTASTQPHPATAMLKLVDRGLSATFLT